MTFPDQLITISIIINILALWIWIRRHEILDVALELREAYRDKTVSDDEYNLILEKLEKVFEK
jgi:hypothetical protein